MKLLLAFAALLLPASLHAALKWERTSQIVEWKPGQTEAIVEFGYKNATKAPQKIVQLKGACVCCTSASASKKNLAPGDTGIIHMRVDLHGKTLPTAKALTVTTDDGEVVSLVLQVRTPKGAPVEIPRWDFQGKK
jgi:hypothetical protein